MIKKYVKKPKIIEAIQWNGNNFFDCQEFLGGYVKDTETDPPGGTGDIVKIIIPTLEGDHQR